MKQKDIHDHIAVTYRTFRYTLAWAAFLFPICLWIGGCLLDNLPLQNSMSAYYHASSRSVADEQNPAICECQKPTHPGEGVMRNYFVGFLFVIGILLCVYQGYTRLEDIPLNLAGFFAIGVAVFPMAWGPEFKGLSLNKYGLPLSVHGTCALLMAGFCAYLCVWRTQDTLDLIEDTTVKNKFLWRYKWIGRLVSWFTIAVAVVSLMQWSPLGDLVYWGEMFYFWSFAVFWFVKTKEEKVTKADVIASKGLIKIEPYGWGHLFRPIKIERIVESTNAGS